jgi:hypothetical protein
MPHNPYLEQRLLGIQQALMAQHTGGKSLPNASIGSERETFLREFLQKLFPAHRRFATGSITDAQGLISGQVDIVVEYPFIPSFPMPGTTDERLFLAESVAMVIEVKSDLSSQWKEVCNTVGKVKALRRDLNPVMTFGETVEATIIPCVAVGYTGYQTLEGLKKRLSNTPEQQRPDGVLVINPGIFFGFGLSATRTLALYTLCIVINSTLTNLGFATPNLLAYVEVENLQDT